MPLTHVFILIAKKNKNVYVLFMLDYPYLLTRYPCWDEYLLKMKQGAKNRKNWNQGFHEEKNDQKICFN